MLTCYVLRAAGDKQPGAPLADEATQVKWETPTGSSRKGGVDKTGVGTLGAVGGNLRVADVQHSRSGCSFPLLGESEASLSTRGPERVQSLSHIWLCMHSG